MTPALADYREPRAESREPRAEKREPRDGTSANWGFPKRILGEGVAFAFVLWLGFLIVSTGIAVGIAIRGEVTGSVVEVASEIIRWFVGFIGVYLATTLLPMHVSHGKTRRDFAIESAIFIVIYTAAVAAMTTASFLLERLLYAAADWPQTLTGDDDHMFDSARDLGLIFTEYWLMFLIWIAAGALIAAGIYRWEGGGVVTAGLALVPVALGEIARGTSWGPARLLIKVIGDPSAPPVAGAVVICVGAFVLTLAMTWPVVRDIPLRGRKA